MVVGHKLRGLVSVYVPHKCDIPECPGDIYRRKLALYDEMATALAMMSETWHKLDPYLGGSGHKLAMLKADAEARDLLARASEIGGAS